MPEKPKRPAFQRKSSESIVKTAEANCLPGFALLINVFSEEYFEIPVPCSAEGLTVLEFKRANLRKIILTISEASQEAKANPQFAERILQEAKAFSERVCLASYSKEHSYGLAKAIAEIVKSSD